MALSIPIPRTESADRTVVLEEKVLQDFGREKL